MDSFDVLVLGGGVAGLSSAIRAARGGARVVVVTKTALGGSATQYAQGGVAAVLEEDVDSPELHLADTLGAGAGLCDVDAVRVLVEEGPTRVRELIAMGAHFDESDEGLAFTREGGHTVARIVHAGGDATGAEIERALVAAVQATAAEIRERWFAVDLLVEDGRAVGVRALDPDAVAHEIRARHTIVATGGAGQCFAVTTNPSLSTGDGIAMALRAGVAVADMEFMQFHPTALHTPSMPRPLLSEALRGEGAVLRDEDGVAFMATEHPLGDLAPRDVVAPRDRAPARRARPVARLARRRARSRASPPGSRRSGPRARPSGSTRAWICSPSLRPPTTCRVACAPTSTARRASGDCGPAARRPTPASTARTDWPRTRCSTDSSSARGASTPSSAGKDAAEATGVMRGIAAWAGRARSTGARAALRDARPRARRSSSS